MSFEKIALEKSGSVAKMGLSVKLGVVTGRLRERGAGVFSRFASFVWNASLLLALPHVFIAKSVFRRPHEGEKKLGWKRPLFYPPYWIDCGAEQNQGFLVTGVSGSGKSTLAKRLAYGLSRGASVVVLDPHSEYGGVVRAAGGRAFDARKITLSLMDLDGCSPGEKAVECASMLRRVLALGDVQAFYLTKCIRSAFASRGFIESDRGSWQRKPPSMSDVVAECDKLLSSSRDASLFSLRRRLESLSASGVFSSKTQLPFAVIASQSCCFDLKPLRSSDAQALFAEVFLRKLHSFMQERGGERPVFVLIDEAQKLCVGTPDEPSYVGAVLREARKFRLGVIVVSQSIKALDPAVASNCAVNCVFLSREPEDAHYASALLCGSKYSEKTRLVEEALNELRQFECLVSTSAQREVKRVRVAPLWEEGVHEVEEMELPFISGSHKQKLFFEELQKLLPNERIVYSDRGVIPPFEIDVTLPERKVAVEYDGVYYHSGEKQKKRDSEKERLLAEQGWKLVRVVDDGLSPEQVREKAREVWGGLVRD